MAEPQWSLDLKAGKTLAIPGRVDRHLFHETPDNTAGCNAAHIVIVVTSTGQRLAWTTAKADIQAGGFTVRGG